MMFLIGIAVLIVVIALWAARRRRSEQLRNAESKRPDIRPLTAAEIERFAVDWKKIEAHFVERPGAAVVEADALVQLAMRTRGYPLADFEEHAHAGVVERYRAGRAAASRRLLRQAMLHYRALFEHLTGATTDIEKAISTVREVDSAGSVRDTVIRDDRPGRGAA